MDETVGQRRLIHGINSTPLRLFKRGCIIGIDRQAKKLLSSGFDVILLVCVAYHDIANTNLVWFLHIFVFIPNIWIRLLPINAQT